MQAPAIDHYENFPVASILLPKRLRYPIALIYRFARDADDYADEGDYTPAERLALLQGYRQQLDAIQQGLKPTLPLFVQLAEVMHAYALPIGLFYDLLDAFSQDVVKEYYVNIEECLDYCRRSANPVGRLLLHLFGQATPDNLRDSDLICSSLQLINFWQDVAIDWQKPRVYLPADDLQQFGVTHAHIAHAQVDDAWRALMRYQVQRARAMMLQGAPLGQRLRGRVGLEIRTIIQGGLAILDKIEAVDYDVFTRRPVLKKRDYVRLLWKAKW